MTRLAEEHRLFHGISQGLDTLDRDGAKKLVEARDAMIWFIGVARALWNTGHETLTGDVAEGLAEVCVKADAACDAIEAAQVAFAYLQREEVPS